MFNCLPCNYIHRTDVLCKFQMQVTSNFWNLTALYFQFLKFAQKRAMLFCWQLADIWIVHYVKTDDILQKQVFFILQWLFLSITLRSGKYHKVLFVNILFKTEQLSFMSGLLNLSYSLCMNLMQCWMFDNILSCPSCNPILHSHILRIHWIPNLSSSKIRLVRWFPGSLI